MPSSSLDILYEDNHLLVINKPPGLATMGVASGEPSLVSQAKQYIKRRYQKPGNVYLGVVSRLDTATSGAIVLARTSKAAARLTEQFRSHKVQKTYWAIVSGKITPATAELVDWVIKDDAQKKMVITRPEVSGAKEARLSYQLKRPLTNGSWLEIELLTGRKHQIRLQLASRGFPVWGEWKYAQGQSFPVGMALHARHLKFEHPVKHELLTFEAQLPPAWHLLDLE